MVLSDLLMFNPHLQILHWKPTSAIPPTFKMVSNKLSRGLSDSRLALQPFLIRHCALPSEPVTTSTLTTTPDFTLFWDAFQFARPVALMVAKQYRSQMIPQIPLIPALSHISTIRWSSFWALALTAITRNVIYRFLLDKIPNRPRLHHLLPRSFPSSFCPICCVGIEDAKYHLFTCPVKTNIWKAVIFEFLWPIIELEDIIYAISNLDFYNVRYSYISKVSAPLIIILSIAHIWKARFRFVFDATPLTLTSSLALCTKKFVDTQKKLGYVVVLVSLVSYIPISKPLLFNLCVSPLIFSSCNITWHNNKLFLKKKKFDDCLFS